MKESRSTSEVTTSWDKRLYFSSDESVINYDEKITTFITIRNLQSCFTAPMNRGSKDRILWVLLTDKWYYNQRWWFSFLLINLGFGPFPAQLQSGYEKSLMWIDFLAMSCLWFFQFPFVWGNPSTPLRFSYLRSLDWKQKNNTQICDLKSTRKGSRKFRLAISGFIRWWINAFKSSDVDLILDMCWWKILSHFRAVHKLVLGKG